MWPFKKKQVEESKLATDLDKEMIEVLHYAGRWDLEELRYNM